jgi:hypothetical protein
MVGMRHFLLILAVVALVGCGEKATPKVEVQSYSEIESIAWDIYESRGLKKDAKLTQELYRAARNYEREWGFPGPGAENAMKEHSSRTSSKINDEARKYTDTDKDAIIDEVNGCMGWRDSDSLEKTEEDWKKRKAAEGIREQEEE